MVASIVVHRWGQPGDAQCSVCRRRAICSSTSPGWQAGFSRRTESSQSSVTVEGSAMFSCLSDSSDSAFDTGRRNRPPTFAISQNDLERFRPIAFPVHHVGNDGPVCALLPEFAGLDPSAPLFGNFCALFGFLFRRIANRWWQAQLAYESSGERNLPRRCWNCRR